EILYVNQRRVFQVFGVTDSGLLAIGVFFVQQVSQCVVGDAVAVVQRTVFLFIHHFQLGVEQAEYRIDKTAGFQFSPLLQAVGGQTYLVYGFFMPGVRVQATGAHAVVELVDFVGNSVLRSLLGNTVDLGINFSTAGRIGFTEMLLVEVLDLLQIGTLGLVVQRTQLAVTLEQQVFEVVSQTGRISRILLAAGSYRDLRIKARLLVIAGQIHTQAVIQFKDMGIQRIIRVGLVDAFVAGAGAGSIVAIAAAVVGAAGCQDRQQDQCRK